MVVRGVLFATTVFSLIAILTGASGADWYVDASVTDWGDGRSPEKAFKKIQEGIDAARDGDTVIVAVGTYLENVIFNGKNIVLRSSEPLDPVVVENTVIDGGQAGPVVTFSGLEDERCVLSGFTIRNGSSDVGGGIFSEAAENSHAHATIQNNIVVGSAAESGGGLAYCDGTIQNNIITCNSAEFQGGGLYGCEGTIECNTITGNRTDGAGGGLAYCDGTIRDNAVANNSSAWDGGGLAYCNGQIRNNGITDNSAHSGGGGLALCGGTIERNIIADNSAGWDGGGLWRCAGEILNNTVAENSAQRGGGLAGCLGASITNCIVWGNFAGDGPQVYECCQPTYSCVQGLEEGVGNTSGCPYFVGLSGGDYHLQSWSPCIDAGDPFSDFPNEPQPNGGRINMGAYGNTPEAASASEDSDGDLLPDEWEKLFFVDLSRGADDDGDGDRRSNLQEYRDGTSPLWGGTWYVDTAVVVPGDGSSWDAAFKTVQEGIDAAWEGETVLVAPGTYHENIQFKAKNILLRSTDPLDPAVVADTVIDGGEEGSVVTFVGSETGRCVLSGFTIRDGVASDPPNERGGGICGGFENYRTRAVIANSVITNNFAWDGGGLVYCGGIIRNNIITNNTAEDDGGGLHRCSGTIVGNRITDNWAGDNGGGIAKSDAKIQNNIICDNSAGAEGGGLRGCTGFILSNTIAGNTARYGDGLALCDATIRNCIIWGGARHGVQLYDCTEPRYCCIDRWKRGGAGNISHSPYFADASRGDYHLQSWSPCIDAGDPISPFSQEPAPNGGRINMGAYGNTSEAASRSPDSDGDQLPDDWEIEVFRVLDEAGTDDADGDLMSNVQEYRRGSDATAPPTVWYVTASATGTGDGTSPATPFKTIQEGINAASDRDTVIVAPGIYFENAKLNGKNLVLRGTDPGNPALVASTVIDGGRLDSVVTFLGSEDETCVLAGFTIRNGSAVCSGGICGGTEEGRNHATIRNNNIVGNSAPGYWDEDRQVWVEGFGGGLAFCDGLIRDNIISNNSSRWAGGGLYGCDATIQNNTVIANRADDAEATGGGLDDCDGTIQNNLVADNYAGYDGGGLSGCDGAIQNNTIAANHAGNDGGGLQSCLGTIRNCIIWGNVAKAERTQIWGSNAPFFCCIQDWAEGGEGNIVFDPRFVDEVSRDYHLEGDSPCVDGGADFYWFAWPQRDLDGNCRLVGPRIDMGCYEYGSFPDTDGDLLSDVAESCLGPFCPNPNVDDSDGDGLRDGLEILGGTDPVCATPPSIVRVPDDSPTIQKALCLAVPGEEIIVSSGTYNGSFHFCGADVTLHSTNPDNPEVVASTILDGGDAAPVVCFVGTESPDCVLCGFTIQNGHADHGCGIRGGGTERHTHATIRNNTITNNYALRGGAGLAWCDGTIENNTISDNEAEENGGALSHCHGTIRDNTITGNLSGYGAGLHRCNGNIRGNRVADDSSGGLHGCGGLIEGNTIAGNFGAGLYDCDGAIRGNTITGNLRSGLFDCDDEVLNNLIVGNMGRRGGGLAECDGAILNNTIVMNSAIYVGGGLYLCGGTVSNCVIWGNSASEGNQTFLSSQPTYSCVEGWSEGGEGNIAEYPQFADPDGLDDYLFTFEDNDYRLLPGSLCIDAGRNSDWMWEATDREGNPRIVPGVSSWRVDMGAYEYVPAYGFQLFITATDMGIVLAWTSQPDGTYTVLSSADLLSGEWATEETIQSQTTATTWTDSDATSTRKFYRIGIE